MANPVKISSATTFYNKKIFPFVWFGLVVLFFVISINVYRDNHPDYLPMMILSFAMAFLGIVLFKKFVFDLADEVYDYGDYLLVKFRGSEEKIPLNEIININYTHLQNPARVTLMLNRVTRYGDEVSFSPTASAMPLKPNPMIRELILRVDRARRGGK